MHSLSAEGYDQDWDAFRVLELNGAENPGGLGLCVHELLEKAAERYSEKIALICGNTTLTFGELNSIANRFARVLLQQGIGNGDLVGVALDRSIHLVAALLAVWKTGAAYVPIDPAFPAERISQMMDDACPKLLITTTTTTSSISRGGMCCLSIDEVLHMMIVSSEPFDSSNLDVAAAHGSDLAYVMYTSGSTGRPKGVDVSHGNVTNFLLSMRQEPGCSDTDRLLAITTVSFDMAVLELFLPLLCGATTVIAQKHEVKDAPALVKLMQRHEITMMQATPAMWQMLLDSGWDGQPRLGKILCGGEALSRALADRLLTCGDAMWNMYGPTEATVYASIWRVSQHGGVIIGGPIANGHLYVLDAATLSPVPLGSPGELFIGGAGVARGYRNSTMANRSRFLDNPFHPGLMYRTGDLARFVTPGKLDLMGRLDGQVKIRGHRIELGDIEAAIMAHEEMSGAVVVCRGERLVAYCIRDRRVVEAVKKTAPAVGRVLRPWLAGRLPDYMMPAFFVEMEAFPVTANGKIDRQALPDPVAALPTPPATATVPAAAELEGQILAIWTKVLGHDRIGVKDNFFEVGGDSARLVRVQERLQAVLGRRVPSPKLFEHYTIRALAAHLMTGSDAAARPQLRVDEQSGVSGTSTGTSSQEDIAIVSMACRLPHGITTHEGFWDLLERGGDAITDTPPGDRWRAADTLLSHSNASNPDAPGDESYCRSGGFLPSIDAFDISFFGISPREARMLDPAQYIMLETCWEGFERAGYTVEQLRGSQTGVFIGTSNILSHQGLNPTAVRDLSDLGGYTVAGSAGGTMSGRISHHLGLQGPAMTIDTACSSSLVTTHLACTALRQRECDMAVSGGVSLLLNPGLHVEFSRLQGMSPDGRCRAFSADAQGTGWSEGSVAVILKRLSDAQRDGDEIHAVIRGSAVNHDGRSASLTTPSGAAQQRLIRTALASAGLRPGDVDYVEAHGTGTKLGDPIEATALAEVFGPARAHADSPLFIGSAKSNVGHTQAAAGLVGLLKVALAMQHSTLPQTLHVTKPTPAVDWEGANMMPVLRKRAWLPCKNRPRRAGVSAFGIGGTNAHVIIQEPPPPPPPRIAEHFSGRTATGVHLPRLAAMPFLLSADADVALRTQAEKLHQHISSTAADDDDLGDMAYSLATTRSHFRRRLVLMARDKTELLEALDSYAHHPDSFAVPDFSGGGVDSAAAAAAAAAEATPPNMAMLFTGQGSQWACMGKDLCDTYPHFGETIREIAAEFDRELEVPLLDVMWSEAGSTAAALLDRTDFSQPALFALEVALWRLWQSWGVAPNFVLGHSLGELVAAHAAGILDLPDACRLVAARGRLMQAQSGDDLRMASLEASAVEVSIAITQLGHETKVDAAAYNTPTQTVISGNADAVRSMTGHFAGQGRKTKTLVVGHAFHSRYLDGMLADFRAVAETVEFHPPRLSIVSSLEGGLAEAGSLQRADYWVEQARGPVRFNDGIQALARDHGVNIFLELGPDQLLCGMGAECLAAAAADNDDKSKSVAWLPSLTPRRKKEGALCTTIQSSLAHLHVRHVPIDWQAYFKPFGCRRVRLPTYAFQRNFVGRHHHGSSPPLQPNDDISAPSNATKSSTQQLGVQFQIAWHPVKIDNGHASGTWGVMMIPPTGDHSAWARRVTAILSEARTNIRLVHVEHLQQAEKLDGLVCLWDSNTDDVMSQTPDIITAALTQLQTAARTQFLAPLVWVTHHAVGTGISSDDEAMRLGAASSLWGLMRAARTEHPELHFRLVDLGQEATANAACILSALMLKAEPECAVRQDRVLVPRMQRVDSVLPKPPLHQFIRPDGAVLITGGLGHLGACVARWLASDHGVRDMVLTSRHGMEASGAEALVAELSRLGVRVTAMAGDIAEPDSISSIMAMFSKHRPLRGVVHAAGVADSGVLSSLTPGRCETTIAPKAYGAWLLHQATREMDLDLFLMFSSISGVLGMPGLANYAAANTFLDALAHLRRAQGLPATSVAYGTWAGDGGMASKLGPTTLSHLAHFGLDPLPQVQGLGLLQGAVASKRALVVAAALDPGRLRGFYKEQGGGGGVGGSGIPPLLSLLLRIPDNLSNTITQTSSSSSFSRRRRRDLPEMLREADRGQHAGIVLNMVRQVVATALGFARPHHIEVDRPLKDIGIDSLTAVQVRNHLATLTGLTLSVNIALLHPNLRALSQALLSQLQDDVDTNASPTTTTTTTTTTTNGVVSAKRTASTTGTGRLSLEAARQGCLDSSFAFDNVTREDCSSVRRPQSVFLTGATGFVGAYILCELLKLGISTHCLVRGADSVDKARQRVVNALQGYSLWEPKFASLIKPTVGDMALPLLGLTEQEFDGLANSVDAICHSGALVDWMRPLGDYIGPNIVSTHEVLRLASRGLPKAVHLVSTISTLPKHMGLDLSEGDLEYGYGTSKYVAERLVAAARWRGARASVYRLPYATASTATGHFRHDRGDFLHNLIVGSLEMGALPAVDDADMSAVLPVDYLAKTIVAVMTRDLDRIGRDFDFLNPRAPTCAAFFGMISATLGGGGGGGKPKEMMSFGAWKQRALGYAALHPASPLARITAVLDSYTDENAAAIFKGSSLVGEHVFGGDDYPAPVLDEQFVNAYLSLINGQSN
ncbi:polyketide synthase [Podospora didyma]|uniref:Polyketide synthase n=1 Tax=Podospora didyma TaxID=330526 RepID=A0AAE0U913_9PEZI|nr:polyketide synthase [Podospora didyma]